MVFSPFVLLKVQFNHKKKRKKISFKDGRILKREMNNNGPLFCSSAKIRQTGYAHFVYTMHKQYPAYHSWDLKMFLFYHHVVWFFVDVEFQPPLRTFMRQMFYNQSSLKTTISVDFSSIIMLFMASILIVAYCFLHISRHVDRPIGLDFTLMNVAILIHYEWLHSFPLCSFYLSLICFWAWYSISQRRFELSIF